MAKLPQLKRLLKQDFSPDDYVLIEKLGSVLNPFMEEIVNSYNKQLNLDNMSWELKEIDVVCDITGIPINTVQFKTTLLSKVRGLFIISANNITNTSTYPNSAPFISFTAEGQIITIKHVTGLPANNKFKIQVIVIS